MNKFYLYLAALIIILLQILSCANLSKLKPTDYVYQINDSKACFYDSVKALTNKNPKTCVEFKDLEGWLVLHPDKLKEFLTKGVDELIAIKNQEKPKN
jgi:hypothetical protein